MKTGIVTFEKAINYGTSLQAVALLKVLQGENADAHFIHHECEEIDKTSRVFDFKMARSIPYTLAHIYNLSIALRRKKRFQEFWDKHYSYSSNNAHDYDIVIAGSDQVWNNKLTANDWFYFLNFDKGTTKKASYAGSFGLSHLEPNITEQIKPLLADFDYLSVREKTAAKMIKDITGTTVPVVLDPTLLLNKQQWTEMADPNFRHNGYIFRYLCC